MCLNCGAIRHRQFAIRNQMSGYSGKSLMQKLGVKENSRMKIVNPPENYFELIETPKQLVEGKPAAKADFIHCFVKSIEELEQHLPQLKNNLDKNGMLWISWPKKASQVPTDITENIIRSFALKIGLVDVKVCAVNEVWSGLKLVYRLKDR